MQKEKTLAYLSLFSIYIIWGTTYLAIRIGVEALPPMLFAGLRWLAAGPILFFFLKYRGYKLPNKNEVIHLGFSGLLLLGVGNGFVVFSEQYIPSGLAALLITTTPFWMVGFEALVPGNKRPNLMVILGIVIGLIGVSLIFGNDLEALFKKENITGIIGITIGVIGWSLGTIYSKYKKVSVHSLMGAAVQMSIAGVVLCLLGVSVGEFSQFHFTNESLMAYLYLVVIGAWVGYGSYMYSLSHLPVSLVSTYAYVNPIIAIFLGWLILDEPVTYAIVIAAFVILVGVMLVKKGSTK